MSLNAMDATLPVIRPITDLRTNLNDVCKQAKETREPLIFTKNGTPSLVVIDSDAYEAQRQRDRMYLALREAEIERQFDSHTLTQEEVDADMKRIFQRWGIDYD